MKHWMLANTMIAVIAIAMAASALAGDTEAQTASAEAEATATPTPTPAPESKDYACEATLGSRTVWSTETAVSDGHARAAMRDGLATDHGFRDNAVIVCADSDLDLMSKRRGDLALGDRMTRNEDALYALESDVEALEDGASHTGVRYDCWNLSLSEPACVNYWHDLRDASNGHHRSTPTGGDIGH